MSDEEATLALSTPGRARWYVAGALAGIPLTVVAVVFLFGNFAQADDVKADHKRLGDFETRIKGIEDDHALDVAERKRIEEDEHTNRLQMWEIAKAVGARQLPAPH